MEYAGITSNADVFLHVKTIIWPHKISGPVDTVSHRHVTIFNFLVGDFVDCRGRNCWVRNLLKCH